MFYKRNVADSDWLLLLLQCGTYYVHCVRRDGAAHHTETHAIIPIPRWQGKRTRSRDCELRLNSQRVGREVRLPNVTG